MLESAVFWNRAVLTVFDLECRKEVPVRGSDPPQPVHLVFGVLRPLGLNAGYERGNSPPGSYA